MKNINKAMILALFFGSSVLFGAEDAASKKQQEERSIHFLNLGKSIAEKECMARRLLERAMMLRGDARNQRSDERMDQMLQSAEHQRIEGTKLLDEAKKMWDNALAEAAR
jgi:hypothetical protein